MDELLAHVKSITETEHFFSDLIFLGGSLVLVLAVYFVSSFALKFAMNKLRTIEKLQPFQSNINMFEKIGYVILRLSGFGAFFGFIAFGAITLYEQRNLKDLLFSYIEKIPEGFWLGLAQNAVKFVALVWVSKLILKTLLKWLAKLKLRALEYKQIKTNQQSIETLFSRLEQIVRYTTVLIVIYASATLFSLPDSVLEYIVITANVYLVVSFGLLVVNALAAIIESLDALSEQYAQQKGLIGYYNDLRHLIPALRKTLEYIVYATVATLVLGQLSFIAEFAQYGGGVIQAIGMIFIARVVIEVFELVIDEKYINHCTDEALLQRNKTIYPIFKSVLATSIYFVVVVMIMRGFGFDPIPLLAGAGILGMVVGLGAQSLISDLVSGFFIILEGTFTVGDKVYINGATGNVEQISLRTTKLRTGDGTVVTLRNGQIGDVINYSNQFVNAIVDIGVDPTTNIDQLYSVLGKLGDELSAKHSDILANLEIIGIVKFSGPEIIIRTSTRVKPGLNSVLERFIRKEMLIAFERAKIQLPFEKRRLNLPIQE